MKWFSLTVKPLMGPGKVCNCFARGYRHPTNRNHTWIFWDTLMHSVSNFSVWRFHDCKIVFINIFTDSRGSCKTAIFFVVYLLLRSFNPLASRDFNLWEIKESCIPCYVIVFFYKIKNEGGNVFFYWGIGSPTLSK